MSPQERSVTPSSLFGAIRPDEMIWSYFARQLARFPALSFEGLAPMLGGELPSHSKSFPARLGNLANALGYAGGLDVSALVIGHTFFPFAVPEIGAHAAERLAATLANHPHPSGAPGHLVLPGSFRLRICPICAAEDERAFGEKYLHRCHQIPPLRVCCKPDHLVPLHETDVYASARTPVTAAAAIVDILPMETGDMHLQRILASAYASLASGSAVASGEQVRQYLGEMLCRRGLLANRQVVPALTARLKLLFDHGSLAQVGIGRHEVGLLAWCLVPKLALVLYVLGESFDKFFKRAGSNVPIAQWTSWRDKAAEHERAIAERVRQLAPEVVRRLRMSSGRRVSGWAIAKELNKTLGVGFSSNWSYRSEVKKVLQEFAEEAPKTFDLD